MAKKPSKTKNSRFGNPAKAAAAEGATANNVISFSDAAAQRSVEKLLPAFADWLGRAGMDSEERDQLARLIMNFFRNYAASVGVPDATNLDVELTALILDDAGKFHPDMRMSVATALGGYLKFLFSMQLWTGTTADWHQLVTLAEEGVFGTPTHKLEAYVQLVGMDPLEGGADRAERQYVRWAVALLEWIGDGRELTATGAIRRKDLTGAAACVNENVVGSIRSDDSLPAVGVPRAVRTMAHVPLLMEYWNALLDSKLIKVANKKVELTRTGRALRKNPATAWEDTALLAYFFYLNECIPYTRIGSQHSSFTITARALAAAASSAPDVAIPFEPDESMHPLDLRDTLIPESERSIRELTKAGLVEAGTPTVVPPSLRPSLAAVLGLLDRMIEEAQDGK